MIIVSSLTHSLTHSLTRSLTPSLTHSLSLRLPRRLQLNPEQEDLAGLLEEGDAMMQPHPDEFDPAFNFENFGFGVKVRHGSRL